MPYDLRDLLARFAGTADAYASTPVMIRQTTLHASSHCYTPRRSRVPVCLRIHVPKVTALPAPFRRYYFTLKAVCVLSFSGISFLDTWDSLLVRT